MLEVGIFLTIILFILTYESESKRNLLLIRINLNFKTNKKVIPTSNFSNSDFFNDIFHKIFS